MLLKLFVFELLYVLNSFCKAMKQTTYDVESYLLNYGEENLDYAISPQPKLSITTEPWYLKRSTDEDWLPDYEQSKVTKKVQTTHDAPKHYKSTRSKTTRVTTTEYISTDSFPTPNKTYFFDPKLFYTPTLGQPTVSKLTLGIYFETSSVDFFEFIMTVSTRTTMPTTETATIDLEYALRHVNKDQNETTREESIKPSERSFDYYDYWAPLPDTKVDTAPETHFTVQEAKHLITEKKMRFVTAYIYKLCDIISIKNSQRAKEIINALTDTILEYAAAGKLLIFNSRLQDIIILGAKYVKETPIDSVKHGATITMSVIDNEKAIIPEDFIEIRYQLEDLYTYQDGDALFNTLPLVYEYPNNGKTAQEISNLIISKIFMPIQRLQGTDKLNTFLLDLNIVLDTHKVHMNYRKRYLIDKYKEKSNKTVGGNNSARDGFNDTHIAAVGFFNNSNLIIDWIRNLAIVNNM